MKRALITGLVVLLFFSNLNIIGVEAAGNTAEEQYETGMGYFQTGDYDHAFSYFLIAGELKEYAPAQNMLAICYRDGLGTEQNSAEAERYFKLASDQGCQEAADNLIRMSKEKEEAYQKAVELFFDGKYNESRAIFESLESYERSAVFLMMCDKLIEDEKVSSSSEKWSENKEIGDIIEFGHYEQDNNLTNGKEPIEWIVIGKENNKVLLLSRYCLDGEIYNKRAEDVTWETCALRKWLNDEFFKNAFSDDEQCYIITSILENKDNPWAGTKGGNQTTDKVFCLSIDEYEHAMLEEDISYGKPTQYAKSRGIEVYNNTYCPWWLRSIGINKDLAAFVWVDKEKNGALLMYGGGTEIWNVISVRPAIWLSLT